MIRQEETIKSFSNAMNKIDEMKLINRVKKKFEKIIVIGEESYKEGIIGLIAGKITEKYNLPAIVVTLNSHIAKGSARSIPGFNIVSVLNEMSKYLLEFGGHPMAAGFSMKTENFEKFKRKIIKIADEKITTDMMQKILSIDMALPEKYINLRFFNAIIQMEPFGIGNPEPVFITYNLKLIGMRKIGKDNKHLKLKIRLQSGIDIEAIGFNMGNRFNSILGGKFLDIVYTLQENLYNDVSALQLNIRDVKISV
jgi:single-stranded-DNA-specific exonuclease